MATVEQVVETEVGTCEQTLLDVENGLSMASGADTGPQLLGGLEDAQNACRDLLKELATAITEAKKALDEETEEMADAGE
jgi:hypothetical protein